MNPDTGALVNKAKESLGALKEGYFDFAASRAYYAMFYVAEALLAVIGHSYSKHSAVISAFWQRICKNRENGFQVSQMAA